MLDVNDLKTVNDQQGHEMGDDLLRNAARIIDKRLKKGELYRVGGDEFVAFVVPADAEDGLEGLAKHGCIVEDGVSIACGVAHYRLDEDATVAEVLARADVRMYRNKRAMKQ